jgi:hypothetical protein
LFVFEPVADDDRVRLTILDRNDFRPLDRRVVEWISDNLELVAAASLGFADQADAIAAAADEAARARFASAVVARRKADEETLADLAQTAADQAAEEVGLLMNVIDEEQARIVGEVRDAVGVMAGLRRKLVKIDQVHAEVARILSDLSRGHARVEAAAKEAAALEKGLGTTVSKQAGLIAESARRIEDTISGEIDRLGSTIDRLRRKLEGAKPW